MTDKNLAELKIESLDNRTFEQMQSQTVAAVLLALGSNYQAEHHLPRVRKQLASLGEVQLSTAFQNPDFTATSDQPKPDYTNQCVYLLLTSPMALQQLQQVLKEFENNCDRQRKVELVVIRQVTMDIDILLVRSDDTDEWLVIADRYPFKAHEIAGVEELAVASSN